MRRESQYNSTEPSSAAWKSAYQAHHYFLVHWQSWIRPEGPRLIKKARKIKYLYLILFIIDSERPNTICYISLQWSTREFHIICFTMAANKLKKVSNIIFNILLSSHLILICFIKDFKPNYFKIFFKKFEKIIIGKMPLIIVQLSSARWYTKLIL